jgi:hypothetical protein
MNATMEEATTKFQAEVDAYVMPKPMRGQSIIWYPHGEVSDRCEIGFVLKVGRRSIEMRGASGLPRESVRNVNDPKLKMSDAQRENGAWDFTDKDKSDLERDKQIVELRNKVSELEDLIVGGKKTKAN